MFKYDRELDKIVDHEVGDCLKSEKWHWQSEGPRSYWIEDGNGKAIFQFEIERIAIDESGDSGGATLVELRLYEAVAISPSYPTKLATFAGEAHDQIERFIEYFRYEVVGKNPQPRVVLIDCRKKRN